MRIGFTGTQIGMTNDQVLQIHMLLGDLKSAGATQATHGMCKGADLQFHDMAKALGYFIVGCPGVTSAGEAWRRALCDCDIVMPPKRFLARNRDIVRESDVVLACPKDTKEQAQHSGTWATIRYARIMAKPLVIVWPDGTGVVERIHGVHTPEDYRQYVMETSRYGTP